FTRRPGRRARKMFPRRGASAPATFGSELQCLRRGGWERQWSTSGSPRDAPGALWTAVYLADCLFVDGRYTQCLAAIEQGLQMARDTYRRELELFLLFLKARTEL